MVVASWKINGIFKADAVKVADEIMGIGEQCTPSELVEYGKNPNTELHKCFEWDDSIAAEKFRIEQARGVIRNIVITHAEDNQEPIKTNVRLFYNTGSRDNTYKPTQVIYQNQSEYERLLQQALHELTAFKKKYQSLNELEGLFEELEKLVG